MIWIKLIIIVFLIALNFYLINKSIRKKKYGLIPGWISISLVSLIGIVYFIIIITSTTKPVPEMNKRKKGDTAFNEYQMELNEYIQHYNEKEKKISKYLAFVDYIYFSVITQFVLGWMLAIYGLIAIERRKLFYSYVSIAYSAGLVFAIFGKNLFFHSSY